MQLYCSKQHANLDGNRFCTSCGEPLPLAVGQIVNQRYQIIRQLGQGGFGRTYLAEDKQKAFQVCVLKEFAPQVQAKLDLQKAQELFEREASVLKKLQHPQIPRFHASLQEQIGSKDFFFLVQDFIEGDDYCLLLAKRRSQGQTFREEEVITLLQKILPVLSYIHSQEVVHRDISPDNLIWRLSDNLPVLIDFGGVKQLPASQGFWFTKLAVNHTLLGKKGYAPEEQIRQGKVFYNSDLYSLAVTALVLLTGKEPQKLYDSYQGIWYWGKEIQVSPSLESVLKKMLAYKPSDRYQTAEEVLQDLPSPAVTQLPRLSYTTTLKTQVVAPGRKHVNAIASKIHHNTKLVTNTLPVWLRPFAVSLGTTALVVLTFAGTFAAINAVIRGITSISVPKISLPQIPSPSHPQPSGKQSQNSGEVMARVQQLEIPQGFFVGMVDNIFYIQHPDMRGRSITSQDAALRDEWLKIADDLLNKLEQAELSTAARRKLGTYTQKNYEKWRMYAKNGRLGNYTMSQLNKETNQKFAELFPGKEQEKQNLQTYGQIWYAIAADKVSLNRQKPHV